MVDGMVTGYRQNPEPFLWYVEQAERLGNSSPKGIVARVLDLLESDEHRSYWTRLRSTLSADDYQLARRAVEAMDETEAGRFVSRLPRIRPLEGYRCDELVQMVTAKFPALDDSLTENVIYTTEQGLAKARAELHQVTAVDIPRSAEEIARARAHGDLSENYEYKAAKEKQARLMQKASRLRDEVARARVISAADIDTSEVSIGCRVSLVDGAGQSHVFVLLGPWDTDPEHGIISYQSPFAGLLMGKKAGDSVELEGRSHTIASIESAV
jgi:transcription elongation factor GreA